MRLANTLVLLTAGSAVAALAAGGAVAVAHDPGVTSGVSALTGRALLPAETYRPGSPASGAFLSTGDRTTARTNGVTVADTGAALPAQPVQGISALIPSGASGEFWAMSDNGFGARANSGDYQLQVYRVKPTLVQGAAAPGGVEVLDGFGLSDPDRHVTWTLACDQTGTALPPLAGNQLPAVAPEVCGDPARRTLTGFDFDLESMQVGADGTFWFGEEFGPFLLHTDRTGKLLEPPIPVPGVRSPQNPQLDVDGGERPTLAGSKGFEGMGISPDRRTLYPLLEGATSDDDPATLRIYTFDIAKRAFRGLNRYRLELPSGVVNTGTIRRADGSLAYPGDPAPPANTNRNSIGELTMINDRQGLLIERGPGGDAPNAPRFRGVFLIELPRKADGRLVGKSPLVDLMAVPDPDGTGGDGDYFRFPYVTIESITPLGDDDLLIVNDNNFPFSNGRSFSKGGPLAADANEFIRVHVEPGLDVDRRVLRVPGAK